jgi:hypothetical protein
MKNRNLIGKIIDSKNTVLGTVFCVLWQNRPVYITSLSAIKPSGMVKGLLAKLKNSQELEDANGYRTSAKLVNSDPDHDIAIFEAEASPNFHIEPLRLAEKEKYKVQSLKLLAYDSNEPFSGNCKALFNHQSGFIQLPSELAKNVHYKGMPIVSFSERWLFGCYTAFNMMNMARKVKPKSLENVQSEEDFIYHGRMTPVAVIRNLLTDIYGENHLEAKR